MHIRPSQSDIVLDHPIAIMQGLVEANDWQIHHQSNDEMAIEISGYWSDYYVSIKWHDDHSSVHISALLDIFVIEQQKSEMMELISRLMLFSVDRPDESPLFCHITVTPDRIVNPDPGRLFLQNWSPI